jgi:UrcA family protein
MRTIIIATLIAGTCTAAPAFAAQDGDVVRVVRTADLDLARQHDQALLRTRLARAVETVCGIYPGNGTLDEQDAVTACRATALAGAKQQLASLHPATALAATDAR